MQKRQTTKNFTSAFPSGFELKASRPPGCNGGVRLSFMADLFTVVPYRSHIIYIVHALIPAVPASQQDFYSILQHWNSRYATATTTTTATIAITSQSVYKISDTDLHIVVTSVIFIMQLCREFWTPLLPKVMLFFRLLPNISLWWHSCFSRSWSKQKKSYFGMPQHFTILQLHPLLIHFVKPRWRLLSCRASPSS